MQKYQAEVTAVQSGVRGPRGGEQTSQHIETDGSQVSLLDKEFTDKKKLGRT